LQAEVTADIVAQMSLEQLKEAGVLPIGARLRILEAFKKLAKPTEVGTESSHDDNH
jgi:hypothetical protein